MYNKAKKQKKNKKNKTKKKTNNPTTRITTPCKWGHEDRKQP